MKKSNNKKGISLIVLVITIVVMIILAAAIILSLQSSGIIGRANEAKTKSDLANAKQVVTMVLAEWQLDEEKITKNDSSIQNFTDYANKKLNEAGFSTGKNKDSYEVTEKGEIFVYPKIPEGFVASEIAGEDTVAGGLVIYELNEGETSIATSEWTDKTSGDTNLLDIQEERNQFVWIPVENISNFKIIDWGFGITGNNFFEKLIEVGKPEDSTEIAEYNAMKKSVEKYGGFYIARYEAGKVENKVVSRKGATPIECGWGMYLDEGALAYSREMYTTTKEVASTLCYGAQWDAIMSFIEDVQNPNVPGKKYIENSTGMGWNNRATPQLTGIDIDEVASNRVKNIYDLAGNMGEWTMDAYNINPELPYLWRVHRGGIYYWGSSDGAALRVCENPDGSYVVRF